MQRSVISNSYQIRGRTDDSLQIERFRAIGLSPFVSNARKQSEYAADMDFVSRGHVSMTVNDHFTNLPSQRPDILHVGHGLPNGSMCPCQISVYIPLLRPLIAQVRSLLQS